MKYIRPQTLPSAVYQIPDVDAAVTEHSVSLAGRQWLQGPADGKPIATVTNAVEGKTYVFFPHPTAGLSLQDGAGLSLFQNEDVQLGANDAPIALAFRGGTFYPLSGRRGVEPLTTAERTALGDTLGLEDAGRRIVWDTDLDALFGWTGLAWKQDKVTFASQAEAEAGTSTDTAVSPQGAFQAIDANRFSRFVKVGEDIMAAVALVGSLGGGTVFLAPGVHERTAQITLGNGSSGTASSYQNVRLIGAGSAPLASTSSATIVRFVGAADADAAVVEIAGRSSGMGVENIYLDANNRAGTCLRIKSNVYGRFAGLLGQNYTRYGCHLTIQDAAPANTWYSTTNVFERCAFFGSTNDNTQAWRLEGIDNTGSGGQRNDPHRNTFIGCQGSSKRTTTPGLTNANRPCGLYLGYTDSCTFVECDFQLDTISGSIVNDRAALKALNGSSRTDGENIKLRYFGNPPDGSSAPNIRYEVWYAYVAGSLATADDVNIIEPADGNGRFIKYHGAAVAIDATEDDHFPANMFFNNCALIKDPSFEDWTTNGNTPGNATTNTPSVVLVFQALADAEETPMYITNTVGITDAGKTFSRLNDDMHFRGDLIELGVEQDNQCRKFSMRLNAQSSTGGASSGHFGGYLALSERVTDTDGYAETARIVFNRLGHWVPHNANQDLGDIVANTYWRYVLAQRLELDELTAAPGTLRDGVLVYADGATWDPLDVFDGVVSPVGYLAHYRDSAWKDLAPGFRAYTLLIADDAFKAITPPSVAGFLEVQSSSSTSRFGHARWVAAGTGASMVDLGGAGANTTFTTGALDGTTGTDTHLTVSSHTDGNIYVENRTGAIATVTVWLRYSPA